MFSKGPKKLLAIFLGTSMCAANVVPVSAENVPSVQAQAQQIVSKMTLEEKVGQMMMPDFRNWNKSSVNADGQLTVENSNEPQGFTVMNDEVAGVIQKYHLGGVILFQPNVQNTEQTVRLTEGLQKASTKIPLLLTIDQEGGLVTRLMSGTVMPGNMALGATNDPNISYNVGKAIGEELNALGINTNFAPDMDVNLNPNNPVIGVRSFGGDPDLVSRMGIGYIKGLMDAKVIGTIKHFPGHGDVATDSHLGLPLVNKPVEELNKVELKPFKAASDAGVDMIMTAHIEYPTLDNTQVVSKLDGSNIYLPATLSKKILTDIVRGQFGFKGVVVTDALNMKAIADNFGQEEAVIRCINAGVDIALMPAQMWNLGEVKNFDKVYNAVIKAVKDGTIAQSRIDEAVTRIITLKIKRGILNPNGTAGLRTIDQKIADAKAIVGSAAHRAIEKEAADKSVTLVKNDNNILPFKLAEGNYVVLFGNSYPSATNRLKSMTNGLNEVMNAQGIKNVNIKTFDYNTSSKNCFKTLTEEMKTAVDSANYVVLGTYNVSDNEDRKAFSNAVLEYAKIKNKPVAVMSIRNPYDLSYLNNVQAYIATYGAYGTNEGSPVMPNIAAGIRAIFGLVNPTGKLPVALPDAANAGKSLYEMGYGLTYNTTNSNPTDNKNNDNNKDSSNTNNNTNKPAPTTQNTTNTNSTAVAGSLPKTGSPVDFRALLTLGLSLVVVGGCGIKKKKLK